jgi:hypothetical protein
MNFVNLGDNTAELGPSIIWTYVDDMILVADSE